MKRGQFAFEYLLVYGIVLFIILGTISVFMYINVGPDDVVPEKCLFDVGFYCSGASIVTESGTSEITFEMLNGRGVDVELSKFTPQAAYLSKHVILDNQICSFDTLYVDNGIEQPLHKTSVSDQNDYVKFKETFLWPQDTRLTFTVKCNKEIPKSVTTRAEISLIYREVGKQFARDMDGVIIVR